MIKRSKKLQDFHFIEHFQKNYFGLNFNIDTIIMAWATMAMVLVLAVIARFQLAPAVPSRGQAMLEMTFGFVENIAKGQLGKNYKRHLTILTSLFLFILLGNLIGQLPLKLLNLHHIELASPTNDINTTLALALIVSFYYFYAGLRENGLGFFKHYLQPVWFMLPVNIIEDFTRPFSLSVRLFANILAGEIMVLVLISLMPVILPIPIMLFEIFVAFFQAFIFVILSAVYISFAENH